MVRRRSTVRFRKGALTWAYVIPPDGCGLAEQCSKSPEMVLPLDRRERMLGGQLPRCYSVAEQIS